MAGSKSPVNIFRLQNLGVPSQVFNWRLWFAVLAFGLMGAARGIDEGLIDGAFESKDFQRLLQLHSYSDVELANIEGNILAMVQIGSVGGALLWVCISLRPGSSTNLCLQCLLGLRPYRSALGHSATVLIVDRGDCHLHGQ